MKMKNRFQILEINNSTSSKYIKLKSAMVEAAKESFPIMKMDIKNKWMTCEILDLIEGRRAAKILGSMKYVELSRKLKCMCRHAKEKWLNNECELTEKENKNEPGNLHQ